VLHRLYADAKTADIAGQIGRSVVSCYAKAAKLGLKKSPAFFEAGLGGRLAPGQHHEAMKAGRFQPGLTPWNKGTRYVAGGRSAETRFRPGNRPQSWLPVGSYRISGDGHLERKIGETPGPNHLRWKPVASLLWQEAHGPIPKGHMVVFKPGRFTNVLEEITLDRVECISRAENARRNHPRNKSPELAKLCQLKGAITRQVNRITKEANEARKQPS
jgi:hypothetical protein